MRKNKSYGQAARSLCVPFRPAGRPIMACSAVAAMLLMPAGVSNAVDWKLTPHLAVSETYSDNIGLAPHGQERSDWVTQIMPGFSLYRDSARLKLNVNYGLQALFYASESDRNTVNHVLDAKGNAELVENLFFLDATAGMSQQNISLLGPQSADNLSLAGNRTDVRTLSLSPYLRKNFGVAATGEARYTHEVVDAGDQDSKADRVLLKLASGPSFGRLGWGLNYAKEKTDFSNFPDVEREVVSGTLSYLLRPNLSLIGTAGREENTYVFTGSAPEGSFWSAGFSWAPTPRTDIGASVGRRFFGSTHALNFNHRQQRAVWNLSYTQDIVTSQSQLFALSVADSPAFTALYRQYETIIPDPVARRQFATGVLGTASRVFNPLNFLTQQTFLEKKLLATLALNGAKNTVVLSLFDQIRDAETIGAVTSPLGGFDFANSGRVEQRGGSLFWSYRVAPRTSSNVSVGYSRNTFSDIDREDRDKFFKIGLTRQMDTRLAASLDFRRLQRDSSQSGSDYRENAIIASVNMIF